MSAIDIQHVEFDRGTGGVISYTILDKSTFLPVDLTGYSFSLVIRDCERGDTLLTKVPTSVSPTSGQVAVTITAADITITVKDRLGYDLYGTPPAGSARKLVHGLLTVTDTVPW